MRKALVSGTGRAFLAGDWLEAVEGSFDLVVANPPYLSAADMAALSHEVAITIPSARARRRS